MPRIFLTIAALLVLAPAIADDTPRDGMSYSKLADYQKMIDELKELDQLNVIARMSSRDPKVKASDITLEARLKSDQVVSIPIAADGAFTLPASPELAQEDPLFVSNQPKGAMRLDILFKIKTPVVTAQRYADLMRGKTHLDVAIKRQAFTQGTKVHGLLFAFEKGRHTLTLHTARRNKVIRSETLKQARKHHTNVPLPGDGKSTFIYVAMDDDLLDENPQTVFDALPIAVIPAI
jgi:hypothetical protein